MRPREALLNEIHDWDLTKVTAEQKKILIASPFIFLVFLVETCGYWDGSTAYHITTTPSDEGYVIFS